MAEQDNKQITVQIAGRPYPLKINANDEATIRKIIKEVNEKITRFQINYTNRDKQDCLSMVILAYAVDLHKAQKPAAEQTNSELTNKLADLDQLLDQLITG